ncbi:iron-containing alcohol dehydrogenase family protein [Halobacillus sp. K22]|uniref:iron-containing alcohol dehydrogenase family protein n=1 Tax=Halobacillus sp. K22 TaxID=3457431 RepID=UPI003FCC7C12
MTNPITNIPIPAILEIKSGIIYNLQEIFDRHGFENILMLFDPFMMEHWEAKIKDSLSTTKLDTALMQPHAEIHDLIKQAFSIKMYGAIVAVGGGSVIDCGKYMAFSRQTPFISIPTSASNDGFASSNCSLMIEGKKTTVPAKVPYGIIADLDIIQNAPSPFILAGVGDLMSNITALYDWEFEDRHGKSRVNAFASMLSKKAVNSFVRTPMKDLKDPTFLKELVSSLTMGGVATIISGNSSPISGSEHLISHALDKYAEQTHMHGIQVGIATYIMANVQEHRAERMHKVFTRTGFFDYVKTLNIKKAELKLAIEKGPEIKPHRYTYLHENKYQSKALDFLDQDPVLQEIVR